MKLGTNDIGSVYLGTNAVSKVYLGTNEVWTSFTGLLDDYSGAAAAYSLRLLSSTYTGDAIRVRIDTTGQPEYNIGFVNNELDTATLEDYCTGGLDAYVKTWYDQSGNGYDASQTTASNQPQIVSAGSTILENGKPSVQFDGIDNYITLLNTASDGSNPLDINGDLLCSIVLRSLSNTSGYIFNNYQGSGAYNGRHTLWHQDPSGSNLTYETSYDDNSSPSTLVSSALSLSQYLITNTRDKGGTNHIYINGTSNVNASDTASSDITSNVDWVIGARAVSTSQEVWNGKLQEIILYPSDQSSNRTGIETNINDFYAIYP
tara:strand:+ start:1213 stop:2166 length:954 start_codon:yes stop_codon:yes gene_type:complete